MSIKTLTSTTVPLVPGDNLKELSLHQRLFHQKLPNNFSSGVMGLSPFGVTFPTKISPGLTSAPI